MHALTRMNAGNVSQSDELACAAPQSSRIVPAAADFKEPSD